MRVISDVHRGALTVLTMDNGDEVICREYNDGINRPYIIVPDGTSVCKMTAIYAWSNLSCVEGDIHKFNKGQQCPIKEA